jgi:hypothetical protein
MFLALMWSGWMSSPFGYLPSNGPRISCGDF